MIVYDLAVTCSQEHKYPYAHPPATTISHLVLYPGMFPPGETFLHFRKPDGYPIMLGFSITKTEIPDDDTDGKEPGTESALEERTSGNVSG